ncbi:hypothetical protein [Pararobbsia alpina]|uniref:Uncharacterized protein n=1 Tax=Pararobbsia alpina TaxID=621374 RepID=A0A6S7BPQ0_9BURK|nr:hypothetical protein [Pararobbsia alpina]CAB3806834.1 hypothetical protein LMG28138_05852 [Pararobbsia alpina]
MMPPDFKRSLQTNDREAVVGELMQPDEPLTHSQAIETVAFLSGMTPDELDHEIASAEFTFDTPLRPFNELLAARKVGD